MQLTVEIKSIDQCHNFIQSISEQGNQSTLSGSKDTPITLGTSTQTTLAKQATTKSDIATDIHMPKGTIKHEIRNMLREKNEETWRATPNLRQSKAMLNDIKRKTIRYIMKQNRSKIRKIIAIATGHNTFAAKPGKSGDSPEHEILPRWQK